MAVPSAIGGHISNDMLKDRPGASVAGLGVKNVEGSQRLSAGRRADAIPWASLNVTKSTTGRFFFLTLPPSKLPRWMTCGKARSRGDNEIESFFRTVSDEAARSSEV